MFRKEYGEEKVQTTNSLWLVAKAIEGTKILWPQGRAGSIPAPGTNKKLVAQTGFFYAHPMPDLLASMI